jgi:hypothetical protein
VDRRRHDEALTDEVKAALNERAAAIKQAGRTPEQQKPTRRPAESEPVPDDVVDAEVEPTADQVWAQILPAAGAKGWDMDALEQRVIGFLNKPSNEADGFELTRFLGAIESGDVA